jgi:hypothetical protein
MTRKKFYDDVPNYMKQLDFLYKTIDGENYYGNKLSQLEDSDSYKYAEYLLAIRNLASKQLDSTGALLEHLYYPLSPYNYESSEYGIKSGELFTTDLASSEVSFDGEILHVFTPLTFDQNWNYSYVFNKSTEIGLSKWEADNNTLLLQCIDTPFVVSVIRKAHVFNHKTFADNDNKEAGNVINAVVRHMSLNDSANVMNFSSKFELVPKDEKEGIDFVFMSRKTALLHPELVI